MKTNKYGMIDLMDERFDRLVVISREPNNKHKQAMWKCKCDCGNVVIVQSNMLRSGHTKSCGCLQRERTGEASRTHGKSKTLLYNKWSRMIQRCTNPNIERYKCYGGRGITVCKEWKRFEEFERWAIDNGYNDNLSIDRIDVNKGYSPDNCRWATAKEQANNTTRNHYLTVRGETHTMSEWSDITGIPYTTIRARINRSHWDPERAVSEPVKVTA